MPLLISSTPVAPAQATPNECAPAARHGSQQLTQSWPMAASDHQVVTTRLMHILFALVGLLLIADLHSSYLAGSARWETNPFMTVLAERFGPHAALFAIKAVDFMCLAGMYALWQRSRAHVVIALALSTAAFVYVDIVVNNYSS